MKALKILIVLLLGCLPISAIAQKGYGTDTINQFDANGEKHGFWIETFSNNVRHLYYNQGQKEGVAKTFNKITGNLRAFYEYKNNELTGVLYSFGNNGHLIYEMREFGKNDKAVSNRTTIPPNKCYYISYHPNGAKKSEGLLLWYDDPELDDAVEYGEWIYYDADGKILRKKIHK